MSSSFNFLKVTWLTSASTRVGEPAWAMATALITRWEVPESTPSICRASASLAGLPRMRSCAPLTMDTTVSQPTTKASSVASPFSSTHSAFSRASLRLTV